jgi:CrcB protein
MVAFEAAHIVGTGGAIGALLRHYVSTRIETETVPLGTFTVNVLGSFVLGLLTFVGMNSDLALLLGTGVCGSFTTFSSFSVETVRLWETDDRRWALVNAVGNFIGASFAIGLAWGLAQLLRPLLGLGIG